MVACRQPSLGRDRHLGRGVGLGRLALLFALDAFVIGALLLLKFALPLGVGVAILGDGKTHFLKIRVEHPIRSADITAHDRIRTCDGERAARPCSRGRSARTDAAGSAAAGERRLSARFDAPNSPCPPAASRIADAHRSANTRPSHRRGTTAAGPRQSAAGAWSSLTSSDTSQRADPTETGRRSLRPGTNPPAINSDRHRRRRIRRHHNHHRPDDRHPRRHRDLPAAGLR